MSEAGWKWLEDRGLNIDMLAEIGFQTGEHKGQELVKIPYVRNGETYLAKFRPVGDKRFFCKPTGVQKSVWNIDALARDEGLPVIITEGEIDAASVMQAGFDRVVSVPDGWTEGLEDVDREDPGAKMLPLIEVEAHLKAAPHVIVASDADKVGASMVMAIRRLLQDQDVRSCEWPEGCKDANDVLRIHGGEALNRCIQRARRVDPPGMRVFSPSEMPVREPRRVLRPGAGLSRMIALEVGQISISTGIPGSGKSTFATFLSDQIRREERCRVGFCMMETPTQRLRDHLSRLVGDDAWERLSDSDRERLDRYYRIAERVDFQNHEDAHDFEWVHRLVHTLAVREQCRLVVIDPWNEIDHIPMPGESVTNYANVALTRLRQWAADYGCHIHLIAHPKKMARGEIPGGYDIADSAAFTNKPALGWTVHQKEADEPVSPTTIRVWKVRDRELYGFGPRHGDLDFDQVAMSYRPHIDEHMEAS